jgi:hypothetical protein
MPGVHQPDPPGLIHDDLRLLPPWRGSSLFGGFFRIGDRFFVPRWLRNAIFNKTYQMVCLVVSPGAHSSTDVVAALARCRQAAAG